MGSMQDYIILNLKNAMMRLNRKFDIKWAMQLKDFEIEVKKENKVYDDI